MVSLKGILTEKDKQDYLAKLEEKHITSKKQKVIENFFNDPLTDYCPYCMKDNEFPSVKQGGKRIRQILPLIIKNKRFVREFLIAECSITHKYVFFWAEPIIEGDLLTGERYRLEIKSFTDTEIREIIDYHEVKLSDELNNILGIKKRSWNIFR